MQRCWPLALLLTALLCPTSPANAQRVIDEEIVWPLPPEAPKIRYVGFLYSERDLGKSKSFFSRVAGALVGSEDEFISVSRPHDLHVDDAGRIFLTNGLQSGFWVFDPDAKAGRLVMPTGEGAIGKPMGIDGGSDGTLYIADARTRRVVALEADGEFRFAYGGADVLLNPVDVAVSKTGDRVYVADSYLHQIVMFDAKTGALIGRIGRDEGMLEAKLQRRSRRMVGTHSMPSEVADSGSVTTPGHPDRVDEPSDMVENRGMAPGEFRYPAFLAVAPDGTLYVSDGMNFRIQGFSPEGEFLRQFGRLGDGPGTFARPKGIGVDSDGRVYVVDAAFNNVQMFDGQGQLLMSFAGFGNGAGQLWLPIGLTVDSSDRIFVADRVNNRIQVFEYIGPASVVGPDSRSPQR